MPNIVLAALEGTTDLSSLKTVFTFLMTAIGDVVSTIASTPLLLLPVGLFVAGGSIGLAKRFIGR